MTEYLNERTYEANFETCLDNSPIVDLQQTYYTTPQEEKKYGYDVRFDLKMPGIPIYIQFKVPNEVSPQKTHEIANHFGQNALSVNLCMPVNPDDGFRQHRNLIRTDRKNKSCLTLYSTPNYCTLDEHNKVFANRAVHQRSVYFLPKKIGKIGSVNSCNVGYFTKSDNAVLYSHKNRMIVDTKDVNAYTFLDVIGLADKKLQMHNNSLQENLDKVYDQKIGKNIPVTKKEIRWPDGPSAGTLNLMIARNEYISIDRSQPGYYAAKITMLAEKARDEMGAGLFLFQRVDNSLFLFQSVATALRQEISEITS